MAVPVAAVKSAGSCQCTIRLESGSGPPRTCASPPASVAVSSRTAGKNDPALEVTSVAVIAVLPSLRSVRTSAGVRFASASHETVVRESTVLSTTVLVAVAEAATKRTTQSLPAIPRDVYVRVNVAVPEEPPVPVPPASVPVSSRTAGLKTWLCALTTTLRYALFVSINVKISLELSPSSESQETIVVCACSSSVTA